MISQGEFENQYHANVVIKNATAAVDVSVNIRNMYGDLEHKFNILYSPPAPPPLPETVIIEKEG